MERYIENNLALSDITFMSELIPAVLGFCIAKRNKTSGINSPQQLTHTFGVRKLWAH